MISATLFGGELDEPAWRDDLVVINERQTVEIRIDGELESRVARENDAQARLDQMMDPDPLMGGREIGNGPTESSRSATILGRSRDAIPIAIRVTVARPGSLPVS